jgi:SAM-dependent methyltransferase
VAGLTPGVNPMLVTAYSSLAQEYEPVLGDLAEETWRSGILVELGRLGRPHQGGLITDLGAGTGIGGRLLRERGWGHKQIGVDNSVTMLSSGAQFYDATVLADITRLPLAAGRADVAVAGFDTLNYLAPEQLRACLISTASHLKARGWLVFDYSSPELLRRRWLDYAQDQELSDGVLRWRNRYDLEAGKCVSDIQRYDAAGNSVWGERHVQYALDTFPLHEAASAAGLHVERVRDLDRDEFSPAAGTHVWVLRKGAG